MCFAIGKATEKFIRVIDRIFDSKNLLIETIWNKWKMS